MAAPQSTLTAPVRRPLYRLLFAIVPVVLTAVVLSPSLHDVFTNWDDPDYVTDNPLIRSLSLQSCLRMFSPASTVSGNYQPVTILSLAVNYAFGKLDPSGYFSVNLLLHLINVLLVFAFIRKLSRSDLVASLTALLFGIHPLHVEAVAWITGRKDLLCALFYLSALIMFLRYREAKRRSRLLPWCLTLLLFVLSMLSKSAGVTLPGILLLIDYFQSRRMDWRSIGEKLPFLALSALFGWLAIAGQQQGGSLDRGYAVPLANRIMLGTWSYMFYLVKFFLPLRLSAFYPYPPGLGGSLPLPYLMAPALAALSAGAIVLFRRSRTVIFGFFFFLITVFFILHVIPVGATVTADRFTYIPYIGLSFVIAWYFAFLLKRASKNVIGSGLLLSVGIVVIALASCAAHERCKVWNNSITLWSDVLDKYPRNPYSAFIGNEYCGSALMQAGRTGEALTHLRMAAAINPVDPKARYNLGNALMQVQKTTEAVVEYRMATELDSGYALAHHNLAVALRQLGRSDEAVAEFRKALGIDPLDPLAHSNLADALMQLGRTEEAIAEYRKALDLDPGNFNLYCNLGMAFMQEHNAAETADCFQQALNVAPADLGVLSNLCATFMKIGRPDLAVTTAEQAMALARSMGDEALAREIERTVETIRRTGSPAAN